MSLSEGKHRVQSMVLVSPGGLLPGGGGGWVRCHMTKEPRCEGGRAQEETVAAGRGGWGWGSGTQRFASCSGLSLWLVVRWCLAGPPPTDRGLLCRVVSKAPPKEVPRLSSRITSVCLRQAITLFPNSSSLQTCDYLLIYWTTAPSSPGQGVPESWR